MNIYAQLLLIAWVVVFLIDLSGVTGSVAGWLGRERLRRPWSCSLCMTWWTCLAWAAVTGNLSVPVIAFIAVLAWGAQYIRALAVALDDFIKRLINKIH